MESPYRRIYSGDSSRRSLYGRPNSAFRTLSRQASTAASTATLGRVSTPLQTARQTLRLPPPKPSISRAGCSPAMTDFFSEVKKGRHGNDRDKCRQNGQEELQEQEPSKTNCNSEHVQHRGAFAVDTQQSPGVPAAHDRLDISVGEQKKTTAAAAGNEMSFGSSWFSLQGNEVSAGRKGGEQVPPPSVIHMEERKKRGDEADCVNSMIPKDESASGESVTLWSQPQLDQHGAIPPHATDCFLSRQPFFTHEMSLDSLHSLPLMPHSLSPRTVLRTELSIEKKLVPVAPLRKTKSSRVETRSAKSEGHLAKSTGLETKVQAPTEKRTARYKASPPTQPGVHTPQGSIRNTKAKPCRKMPASLGSQSGRKARSSSCGLPPERLSRGGPHRGYTGRLSYGRRQQLSRSCQQTPQPQLSPVTPAAVNLTTDECLTFPPLSASLPHTCSLSSQVPPFSIDVKALREATASLRPEGSPLPEPESFNPVPVPVTQYTPKREKLGKIVSVHGNGAPVDTEGLSYPWKHFPPLSEAELATSASALCPTVSSGVSSPDHEVPQKAERKGSSFQSASTYSDTQSSRPQLQRETKQDAASSKERESRVIPGKGKEKKCREDSPSKNIVLQGLSPRSRSEVKREMKRWFKERKSAAASRQGDFFPPNSGGESHTLNTLPEDLGFHSPEHLVLYYKKQIGKRRTA